MRMYGIQATAKHLENDSHVHGKRVIRKEFPAWDRKSACAAFLGWLQVSGYHVGDAQMEVIADGMTFADHMVRESTNMAARLSLRYGVSVEGPNRQADGYGWPMTVTRLWLPNGHGVSISAKLSSALNIDTEMVTIREDAQDGFRVDFSAGIMEYEQRVDLEDASATDAEIGEVIEGLTKLPAREDKENP